MKKILAVALIAALAVCLAGCQEKLSTDPLVAKWVLKYNDDRSQVLFSFEAIGDLEIVIWDYDDQEEELKQTAYYVGSYVADEEAGTITYDLKGETYVFEYSLEDKAALTLTYDGQTLVVPYVMTNSAK